MAAILRSKFRLLIRKPQTFLLLTILTIILALLIGNVGNSKITIPVFSPNDKMTSHELWGEMQQSELFDFQAFSQEETYKMVREGKAIAGVRLTDDTFTIIIANDSPNVRILHNFLQNMYSNRYFHENIVAVAKQSPHINVEKLTKSLHAKKQQPFFHIVTKSFRTDDTFIYDSKLQTLFGFSLFIVVYTIAFNVVTILTEKQQGVWDRLLLSPVRKWELYTGNLFYSFLLGYVQVAFIFCIFHFIVGIDFHGGFIKTFIVLIPYVFTIVALSLLVTSLVNTYQQFSVIITFMAVSFAMIGGAYWPLEIVQSDVLLYLAKFDPIFYGMEALKQVTIYHEAINDVTNHLLILVLMGVIFMGVGINLMERKAK